MKRYAHCSLIVLSLLLISQLSQARMPKKDCNDLTIKAQADGLKQQYIKQNMRVFQEAVIPMVSMEPSPVAVKLTQGKLYHLIFVGAQQANRLTLEVFDGKDKKIDEKMVKGNENYIVYSFIPTKTDVYLVMLTQRKGAKDLCGSFTVMMPDERPKQVVKEEPAQQPATDKLPAKPVNKANAEPVNNPRYRPNVIKKQTAAPAKQH